MLLFVAIEPEGKQGHFNVLFHFSNCLLQENKKARVFPHPQANSSPSSSTLSSNSSRASTTRDRNGFKEHKLYQSFSNLLEGHLQVSDI